MSADVVEAAGPSAGPPQAGPDPLGGSTAVPGGRGVVSPGVWRTAWRRFKGDRVGMVSLVIVAAFLLLIVASASGLVSAMRPSHRRVTPGCARAGSARPCNPGPGPGAEGAEGVVFGAA